MGMRKRAKQLAAMPENKPYVEVPKPPGILVLTTQYSAWYWVEGEGKVCRYTNGGFGAPAETGAFYAGQDDLFTATATAANREYKRILNERKAAYAKANVIEVDTPSDVEKRQLFGA